MKIILLISLIFLAYCPENYSSNSFDSSLVFSSFEDKECLGYRQGITILEPGIKFFPDHPAFKNKEVKIYDVSRQAEPLPYATDLSSWRYPPQLEELVEKSYSVTDHIQQITSILIGNASSANNFSQGLVPQATVSIIHFSQAEFNGMSHRGWNIPEANAANYTFTKAKKVCPGFLADISLLPALLEKKVDDSIYEALRLAFASEGRVISGSFCLRSVLNWENEFRADPDFIDFLAKGLKDNDKILIFSAGNDSRDITDYLKRGYKFYKESNDPLISGIERTQNKGMASNYLIKLIFKQYAEHPVLRKRVLIVINADIKSLLPSSNKNNLTFANGTKASVSLYNNTNYPGSDSALQDICVTAWGTHRVAKENDGFAEATGTSLAVPVVAAYVTLLDEYYKKKRERLTGPDLVEMVKKTCVLPSGATRNHFGWGIIDPSVFFVQPAVATPGLLTHKRYSAYQFLVSPKKVITCFSLIALLWVMDTVLSI